MGALIFVSIYDMVHIQATIRGKGMGFMTLQEIEEKFVGRTVDEDKLNYYFDMMGRFGKASMYTFSFNTQDYTISTDVCVERGRITGIVTEKEQREDDWGYNPEPGPSEMQPEEYETLAKYLNCVVA